MKKIGIVAAMKVEIGLLLDQMSEKSRKEYAGASFYEGKIAGCETVLVECGIGKVNSALHTQIMIDKYDVGMILNTGIAGGINPKLSRMAVVVADKLTYHDTDRGMLFSVFPGEEWFFCRSRHG